MLFGQVVEGNSDAWTSDGGWPFCALFPKSLGGAFNIGPTTTDAGYIAAALDATLSATTIDPNQIFLFGYSIGAYMASALMCHPTVAPRIAAVATWAGTQGGDLNADALGSACSLVTPNYCDVVFTCECPGTNGVNSVHLMHIFGTTDANHRGEGGQHWT